MPVATQSRHSGPRLIPALFAAALTLLLALPAAADVQTLQNDTWAGGGFQPLSSAYICFADETYSTEFEAPDAWYPFKVLKLQTAFVPNPLDALMGNPGTPCAQFRVSIWRGSGTANPGPVMWDSVDKFQKTWDVPGDGQLHDIDLEKDLPGGLADVPVVDKTTGKGRVRIGLRASASKCANGSGNGSYPGMAVDGASPKPTYNWGYGWAVGLSGCAGGKSGNPFWVTAEGFGIKGNFVLRAVVDTAPVVGPDPDATGGEDASFWDDTGEAPDSGELEDSGEADNGVAGGGKGDGGIGADATQPGDGAAIPAGQLTLTAISPACVAIPNVDTAVKLTGSGFAQDMKVTINDVEMEVISATAVSADVLIKAKSLPAGAFTVKVAAGGTKAALVGEAGLRVGSCGIDAATPNTSSGCSAGRELPASPVLLAAVLAVLAVLRRKSVGP